MQCGPIFHPPTGTATARAADAKHLILGEQISEAWIFYDFFASLWHDICPVFAHKLLKLLKSEPLDHGMTMGGWFHTLTCSGSHGTYPVATSPYYSRPPSTNQRGAGAASESETPRESESTSSKQRHTLPSEREKGGLPQGGAP